MMLSLVLTVIGLLVVMTPPSMAQIPGNFPTEYSTTIEMNFDTLGYTLSYEEYYSRSNRLLRTQGRYDGRSIIELTQFNDRNSGNDTFKVIDLTAEIPCTAYYLTSSQNTSLVYQPSYAILQLLNYSGFSYTNLGSDTMGDRQTNSTHYQSGVYTISSDDTFCNSNNCDNNGGTLPEPPFDILEFIDFSYTLDNNQYSATFMIDFYSQAQTGQGVTLPLRAYVSGSRVNTATGVVSTFNNTIDWVNFRRLDTSQVLTYRNAYRLCQPNSTALHYRPLFPTASTVVAANYAMGTAPPTTSFPSELFMVLEGQTSQNGGNQAGPGGGGAGNQNQNFAMQWVLDENSAQESITTQQGWATTATKTIYQYATAVAYPTLGVVFTIRGASNNYTCTASNLTTTGQGQNSSPLRQSRARTVGSFADFFVDSSFDQSNLGYAGRNYIRSVPADTWVGTFTAQTGTNASFTFTWTTYVYTFPQGWQYPGRTSTIDQQLPLLIVNNGTMYNTINGNSWAFRDTWNIYELIPAGVSDSSWWTEIPAAYSCPALTPLDVPPTPPTRTVSLPSFSANYQATIEQSYSASGMTLSYDEYSSWSTRMLRADGRYDSRAMVEITSFSNLANSPPTFTNYNTMTGSCTSYTLDRSTQNNSLLFLPTYFILQRMNYSGLLWQISSGSPWNSQFLTDRNIPATVYTVNEAWVLEDGTFCDATFDCDDVGGNLNNPGWAFLELLDPEWSAAALYDSGTSTTDEPTYMYQLTFNLFVQSFNRVGVSGAVPLRLEINGTRFLSGETVGQSFTNIFDWVNYRALDTSVFDAITTDPKYGACSSGGVAYRATFPNATGVAATQIAVGAPPPASAFPSQFTMVLEAQQAAFTLRQNGNGTNAGPGGGGGGAGARVTSNNYAAIWSYDSVSSQEAVTSYSDNYTLATYPTTLIYEYSAAYDYGAVYQVDGGAGAYTCIEAALTDYDANPLSSERGGVASFTQLFKDANYDLTNFKYVGRSLLRGIDADLYTASYTNVPVAAADQWYYGNMLYTYTASIWMYPVGWTMVGRDTAADLQLPFRVTFVGTQLNVTSGISSTFTDIYNIFEFFPASDIMTASSSSGLTSSSWFTMTPSAYSCPAYVATSSGSSSSLSGGAIAGIVIGVLVGVACLVAAAFIVIRRIGSLGSSSSSKSSKSTSDSGEGKWRSQTDSDAEAEPSTSRFDEQEMV